MLIEAGNLGSLFTTYHEDDKGSPLDAWREGDAWHLRWGARSAIVEFGRGKHAERRPWRVSWGFNDQVTLHAAKAR